MSSALPKITVITPSFNQGAFISETIESVLSQKYPNLEYWVIDGGSTDQTVSILKKYGKKINWVSEKDEGQTHAINKGLQLATGDIVAYLNSDDVYLPETLLTVGEFFQNNPETQWLTGDYFIIDENGREIHSFVANYKRWLRAYSSFFTLAIANYIIQPSTFWRRSLSEEIGIFDQKLRYCMDYDYWMRLIKLYPPFIDVQPFSLFRVHSSSKGGSAFQAQFAEEHRVLQRYTKNNFLLLLHKLHSWGIVLLYKLIK